jgi:hypothetical protein
MRRGAILAALAAVALTIFYYFTPSFLAGGAPCWLIDTRPFAIADSVMLLVIALYQVWRAERSGTRLSGLRLAVVWVSFVVVLGLLLFPEPMANLLPWGGST